MMKKKTTKKPSAMKKYEMGGKIKMKEIPKMKCGGKMGKKK